jgi:DNA-binding transcriptional regulator YhcF (GntR family)
MEEISSSDAVVQQFVIVPLWVMELPITATALRVYCAIRSHADARTGKCFPSRRRIAILAHCSMPSVDRAVKQLVEQGALGVKKRKSANGDQTSNLYTVFAQRKRSAQHSAQRSAQVATNDEPPSADNEVTGSHTNDALTNFIMNHKQEQDEYPVVTQAQRSRPTLTQRNEACMDAVDRTLRAIRTRSAILKEQ